MIDDFILLITGCIYPNRKQPYLTISDPKVRYEQYIESIKYYINCEKVKTIVFCDNSNYLNFEYSKMLELAEKRNKKFEWLTFQGDDKSVETKGKGYGEGEIIKYALSNSKYLIKANSFAKVTGRLIISNIDNIIGKMNHQRNYFNCDLYSSNGVDTRFYYCQKEFYEESLENLYLQCNDVQGITLEKLFYSVIKKANYIKNIPYYPVFVGVSAGNGIIYSEKMSLKLKLANLLCILQIFNYIYEIRVFYFKMQKKVLQIIPSDMKFWIRKKIWRKRNKHNLTEMGNDFDLSLVKVGKYSYGAINVVVLAKSNYIIIGHYVSIAPNVTFILNAEHYVNHISTYPFKVKMLLAEKSESFSKGNIVIDDDVWIGYGATILSGVHIGQGAIISACALVTKDVPPYAIVGGVPAKIIKYRFETDIINELITVDFSKLNKNLVNEHVDEIYKELINRDQIDWFPRK